MHEVLKGGLEGRTVLVSRTRLLKTLHENREKHSRDYKQAVIDYKDVALERSSKALDKAKRDLESNFAAVVHKINNFDPENVSVGDRVTILQAVAFDLRVPEDHTKAYDVAIQMADWEVNDNVELTQAQFQCFVLDDWDWKRDFERLQRSYALEKMSYGSNR